MTLYDAIIPPLKRLTDAVPRLLARLDDPVQLETRLAPDSFNAAEHLCVALGFVARTVMPLMGDDVPDMPFDTDPGAVLALAHDMRFLLDQIPADALDGAETRTIRHTAGEADLTQSGQDYAVLYALPNAQFHLTLAYASLRHAGARIGKGDLDGFHVYGPGTSFVSDSPLN